MRALAVPAVLLLARLASAGTWYVDASLATGANDGTSWANAFQGVDGLQSAISAAGPGDQIWVAGGTYKPTATADRSISFELKSTVEMYGGFAGGETLLTQRDPLLNTTALSGDLAGDDGSASYGDNSYHVIHATFIATSTLVDGFVITGGNADGGGTNQDRGGGIQLDAGSNALFRSCVVSANRCALKGGGVHSWNSSPVFESVRFESNLGGSHASQSAGFVAEASTNPSSFVTLDRCTFLGNTGNGAGGALINLGSVQLTSCLLANNTATGAGGAGALAVISGGSSNLVCCTIVANTSTTGSAGGLQTTGVMGVSNSIVYFNSGAGGAQGTVNQIRGIAVTPSASYSCVQGGYAGTGNTSADPQLPGTGVGDFGLAPSSPCIDAGSNPMLPGSATLDLAGHARRIDVPSVPDTGVGSPPICDMGCLEFVPSPFTSFCSSDGSFTDHTTPCPCGNNGSAGHGCANSFEADGAVITATGTPAADDVVLESNGTPGTTFTLFQQHDALDDRVLHDGVLCAGGNLVRLRGRAAVGGQAFFPNSLFAQDQTLTLSQRGGVTPGSGAVRYYSAWYRNASSTFCPPATANVTNGISVTW